MKETTAIFKILCTLVIVLAVGNATASSVYKVWSESAMTKVFRDTTPGDQADSVAITMTRNEYESFQIVITPLTQALSNVDVSVGSLQNGQGDILQDSGSVDILDVYYVDLQSSTTEGQPFQGGLWPDPLPPLNVVQPLSAAQGENQPIWIRVHTTASTPPGTYSGSVMVTADGVDPTTVTVEVEVLDITLPAAPSFKFITGITFRTLDENRPSHVEEWYQYAEFGLKRNIVSAGIPFPSRYLSGPTEDYVTDSRCNVVNLSCWGGTSPTYQAELSNLSGFGVAGKVVLRCFDEINPSEVAEVLALEQGLNTMTPLQPSFLTLGNWQTEYEGLFGYVDIWCPNTKWYLGDKAVYDSRRAAGDGIWWYTAGKNPNYPYATLLVDDDGISPRMWLWTSAFYDIGGTYYWGFNLWDGDPLVDFPAANPTAHMGNGCLIYRESFFGLPGSGPISSIRYEMVSEGMEDMKCFDLMKQAVNDVRAALGLTGDEFTAQGAVEDICSAIITNAYSFSRNPADLEAARLRLLDEIQHLSTPPYLILETSPSNNANTVAEYMTIQGTVEEGATVTVGGQLLLLDADNNFTATVILRQGINEIPIHVSSATDSKTIVKTITRQGASGNATQITSVQLSPAENKITLGWPSSPGSFYDVGYSSDLVTWLLAISNVEASGTTTTFEDSGVYTHYSPLDPTTQKRFYRVYEKGAGDVLGLWLIDEGSGQVINDATLNGSNGYTGLSFGVDGRDPDWTAGGPFPSSAYCLDFVRGNGDVAVIPATGLINDIVSGFTIEGWIKIESDQKDRVFWKGEGDVGLSFQMSYWAGGSMMLMVMDPSGVAYFDYATGVPVNQWIHVAGGWDAATGTAKIFINAQETSFAGPSQIKIQPSAALYLGWDSTGSGEDNFEGKISQVRLSGRLLDSAELGYNSSF